MKQVRCAYTIHFTPAFYAVAVMLAIGSPLFSQIPRFNSYSAASATVYLDFDGHLVKGTAWNWEGPINAKSSGLKSPTITEIYNRVSEDFRIFNLNITTDSSVYAKAPVSKRIRIIFTPTSDWYGYAAGVSFINSFTWGDDTPAWVFCHTLEDNPKYVGEAASHEIGHSLGLQHQSTYNRNCDLVTEYAEGKGFGEIAWAPIMGVGYYNNFTIWTIGPTIEGCSVIQNDISVISKGENNIGFRSDDHANSINKATVINIFNNNFSVPGIINNSTDKDFFKITLPRRMKVTVALKPHSAGPSNSGADVDLSIALITSTGLTVGRFNPSSALNADIDTVLAAGNYFMAIDGTGNQNVSDYGSVGLYSLSGSLQNIAPTPIVLLRGNTVNSLRVFNWSIDGYPVQRTSYLEYSINGSDFVPLANIAPGITSFTERVYQGGRNFYRVRTTLPDETMEYSNVVELENATPQHVVVAGNVVSDMLIVKSSGEYSYQLVDLTGRILGKGILKPGQNDISIKHIIPGVLLLNVFNQSNKFHFKIIKQ